MASPVEAPRCVGLPPACPGLNAGGSYRLLPVEMGLSRPNFLTCSLWAVNTVKLRKRHHLRKLTRDTARAVNRAYAKFWPHRGGGKQVILLMRAGEGVAWRGVLIVVVSRFSCDRLSVRLGPGCTRAGAAVASRHRDFQTRRPR
jgi:hypothetical protein